LCACGSRSFDKFAVVNIRQSRSDFGIAEAVYFTKERTREIQECPFAMQRPSNGRQPPHGKRVYQRSQSPFPIANPIRSRIFVFDDTIESFRQTHSIQTDLRTRTSEIVEFVISPGVVRWRNKHRLKSALF